GSFYAFSIWIGIGVAAIYHFLHKKMPKTLTASLATLLCLAAVPLLMASENWDDHDRSGRTSAPDFGRNYLNSVEEKGVIFTNGDNDTYPLWYCQEVEGVGTSKRVCNLSYLQTDWYVNQMKRKTYESDPLPISFTYDQFVQGTRDVVYIMENPRFKGKSIELGKALDFIKDDDPATKISYAENAAYLPLRSLYMVVDKEEVIRNGVVAPEEYNRIVDTMFIDLPGSYITKDQLMILDMLYHNHWERPIYYAISVGTEKYMSLDKYFRLEGLAYRIVPVVSQSSGYQRGYVDTEKMYDNIMNKFLWGNIKDPKVYADENNRRMLTNMRNNFHRLAETLLSEGKKDSCLKVLDKCFEEIPPEKVPHDYFSVQNTKVYLKAGAKEKAEMLIRDMSDDFLAELRYYFSFSPSHIASVDDYIRNNLYFLNELTVMAQQSGNKELFEQIKTEFESYYNMLISMQ
nr:hypothetical protein [Prolixibacteraceae bacterium]